MSMVGDQERRDRFSYALRKVLMARKMSERQLANRLEIDPRKIAAWRSGKSLPDLYQTQDLVRVLRVKEELFRNPLPVPEPEVYPIEDYLLDAVERGGAAGLQDPAPPARVAGVPAAPRPRRQR
jgi:transcriptional regulator with XRE-family HTH domain